MPIIYLTTILAQVLFAYHAYRTGRDRYWIFIILIFPGMGSFIYFIVEVLPEILHGSAGRTAQAKFKRLLDPDKDLRVARYAVETAPTVTNRVKLAQILMARDDYNGAIATLQPALADHFAEDPMLLEGLAYAYFYKHDYRQALDFVERICNHKEWPPKDYIKLLRARLFQELGEREQAETALLELVKSFPGEEARIALAQLYAGQNRYAEARQIYQDIVTRSRHAPQHYRKAQQAWINQAQEALRRLPES